MKTTKLLLAIAALFMVSAVTAQQHPKREFRGAWIHTVHQRQYAQMTPQETQAYLTNIVDSLQLAGINAVIFQVRPSADALYPSELEPWSRYLTGEPGVAPDPMWDPLQFMIDLCHERNMELHAWLNPYRVTTNKEEQLPVGKGHIYDKHPEWFVRYGGQILFDPGLPECRDFIVRVVHDIISRYDVDAIHMDDYFYPYPVANEEFPDSASYARYGNGMSLGDWRRENVNMLIEDLHADMRATKPWVRLGISPFGIWRNITSDPRGSRTAALQNYDDLYADVILWTEKGWVDYMVPQLYWKIEHPRAGYDALIRWWNDNAYGRHLYIGISLGASVEEPDLAEGSNQLTRKIELSRYLDNVNGTCMWPGYTIVRNYKGAADQLIQNEHSKPALIPAYEFIDDIAPAKVKGAKMVDGKLEWKRAKTKDPLQEQIYFVVYRFDKGEKVDIEKGNHILTTTRNTSVEIDDPDATYVVTDVDRCHNESEGVVVK